MHKVCSVSDGEISDLSCSQRFPVPSAGKRIRTGASGSRQTTGTWKVAIDDGKAIGGDLGDFLRKEEHQLPPPPNHGHHRHPPHQVSNYHHLTKNWVKQVMYVFDLFAP